LASMLSELAPVLRSISPPFLNTLLQRFWSWPEMLPGITRRLGLCQDTFN
ncbi:hypothetical protein T12_14457, partial [Trichinella patagoniensis]